MERFQVPEQIRDTLQRNGISPQLNSDPQEYEVQRVAMMNQVPGSLTGYDCPRCLNRGSRAELQGKYIISIECPCMAIRRSIHRAQKSGLGKRLEHDTFDAFQTPERWHMKAKKLAQDYAVAPSGWFVASGAPGSGKTHLCTAICRKLLDDGRAVRYELWRDMAQKIKAATLDGDTRAKLVDHIKNADVLYLDDFLKTARGTAPTKADIEIAFDIIGARYNAKALTLLSTELSMDELLSLDEALGSRIYEASGNGTWCLSITGEGKNWRLRQSLNSGSTP